MRRRIRRVAAVAGIVLAAAGLTGCGSSPKPAATVAPYLAAWGRGDYAAMAALVDHPPATFAAVHRQAAKELGITTAVYRAGPVSQHGADATVAVTSTLATTPYGPLDLHGTLALHRGGGSWKVEWTSRAIADQLGAGDRFAVSQDWPARAEVLGVNGVSLTPGGVVVGLVGQRITDAAALTAALTGALAPSGVSAATVGQAVAAAQAKLTVFEPVATIPQAVYDQIRPAIYPLPGTSFQTQGATSTITPDLAAHVVGHVGPITAEQLKALGAPYTATATAGQGGIEAAYERQLAGTPGSAVTVVDARGRTVATVASTPPKPGTPLRTGIDPGVQRAAEAALNGVAQPAAIVAMRASTGQILASVSRPTSSGFDLALVGSVPPGSTFKVITTTALLQAGLNLSTAAACPPTISVGGRTFHNFEHESQTGLTLLQAFALSCNTAFIGLATSTLHDPGVLTQVAGSYGLGADIRMGLPAYGGKVPPPASTVDLAATAIGQGQITVSPLAMATVAATADSGALRLPQLVVGAPDDTVAPVPLPATVLAPLHTMMGAVVTSGTAAGAGLPAGTFGKTGTAEFGSGTNPATHAWFLGYKGDVAFAVFVSGGGVGGTVAAPLAAKMLKALPAGY